MKRYVYFAHAVAFVLPMAHVTIAFAQQTGGAAPAGGGGAPPASGEGSQAGGGGGGGGAQPSGSRVVTGPTTYQYNPLGSGVAPLQPGQTLGGGNAQYSSSKPITGNERDGFDFKNGGGGGGSVHGGENSSFVLGESHTVNAGASVPGQHTVRKGDTLWAICDFYFHNPYQWPRVWAYNPQIQNPHWIYPGDLVKLRGGAGGLGYDVNPGPSTEPTGTGGFTDRRKQVPPDTVFLRTQGYIDDDSNNWGELNGSAEDKLILTDFDEVYLRIGSGHDVKIGQELTVYRPLRSVGKGKLVQIQGTVKVDQWNPKERVARARITESLDAIERGARIGPIQRRFEVVPPKRDEKDIEATVLTSVHPGSLYGQNTVVFIDKGEEAGLQPGNRLLVIRKGDAWHRTQPTRFAAKRIALEDESPAATENVPRPRDEQSLPEETIAELRVVNVRKDSAMCIVNSSKVEIETGDHAFARKGY